MSQTQQMVQRSREDSPYSNGLPPYSVSSAPLQPITLHAYRQGWRDIAILGPDKKTCFYFLESEYQCLSAPKWVLRRHDPNGPTLFSMKKSGYYIYSYDIIGPAAEMTIQSTGMWVSKVSP